jgi:hypothetical protein
VVELLDSVLAVGEGLVVATLFSFSGAVIPEAKLKNEVLVPSM